MQQQVVDPGIECDIGLCRIIVKDQGARLFQSLKPIEQCDRRIDGLRQMAELLGDACAKPGQGQGLSCQIELQDSRCRYGAGHALSDQRGLAITCRCAEQAQSLRFFQQLRCQMLARQPLCGKRGYFGVQADRFAGFKREG
ncbi:hypothetical protein D3C84_822360 [compost metagenome]